MNPQAVLRGALRQQTAFTLVLLAMERWKLENDNTDNYHDVNVGDNDYHDNYYNDVDDEDDTGTSDKSILRRVNLSSHQPFVFSIRVGFSENFLCFLSIFFSVSLLLFDEKFWCFLFIFYSFCFVRQITSFIPCQV